jgi:SMODS-associated and fused to various effectors sensor domain/SAVED-fused 2TM effector domain
MNVLNWAMSLINQLVAWHTRKRNLGISMMAISSMAIIGLAARSFSFEATGVAGIFQAFRFSTSEGLPAVLQIGLIVVFAITFVIGLGLVLDSYARERRETDVNRVVVVEMRGLVDTSDQPLINAVPPALVGRRLDALVDVRRLLTGPTPNIGEALEEIGHVRRTVLNARGDTTRAHVKVLAGGVMHVPLLFYAGTLFDDEGKVVLMDWERTAGRWCELNGADSGSRFDISGLDTLVPTSDVVVAVSASYMASLADIAATFHGLPVVHLALARPEPNVLWSEKMQAGLTQQFLQTMADLAGRGIRTVHLVLAAPASLSIRFGMAYDHRNMPDLQCYQRERDHVPPYPWSIQMPTAAQAVHYLETPAPAVVAL